MGEPAKWGDAGIGTCHSREGIAVISILRTYSVAFEVQFSRMAAISSV